jgi:hypothetical protein
MSKKTDQVSRIQLCDVKPPQDWMQVTCGVSQLYDMYWNALFQAFAPVSVYSIGLPVTSFDYLVRNLKPGKDAQATATWWSCKLSFSGKQVTPLSFAETAHGCINQRRKYTDAPYICHPIAVADIVASVPHTDNMLAAALLHDTVEDTPVTLHEIREYFGPDVATLVEMLTDVSKPSDGNRAARKAIDRAHTAKASPEAMTIKLADLLDNTRSIVEHDLNFARVYLREKLDLLDVLGAGDKTLYQLCWETATAGMRKVADADEQRQAEAQ